MHERQIASRIVREEDWIINQDEVLRGGLPLILQKLFPRYAQNLDRHPARVLFDVWPSWVAGTVRKANPRLIGFSRSKHSLSQPMWKRFQHMKLCFHTPMGFRMG